MVWVVLDSEGYCSTVAERLDVRLGSLVRSNAGQQLRAELRRFVAEQSSEARLGERLPGSTEILEAWCRQSHPVRRIP